jgi:xanthine dehydrogenase small subunit
MRDYLLFYVNGQRCPVGGDAAFSSLSDFLRDGLRLVGTKVVCAEGDCGACTVLVGRPDGDRLRFETVDSCIYFLYQLDGKHVVTVEGLSADGRLTPVQQGLVDHHGSQCGFCTPGFVMALTGLFEDPAPLTDEALRVGLTGNLCRCTGYLPILEAACSVDRAALRPLAEHYSSPALVEDLRKHALDSVLVRADSSRPDGMTVQRTFFSPRVLEEAVAFKARHPEALIVSGGTEVGVLRNKQAFDPPTLLSLTRVPGLGEITRAPEGLVIGANATWTEIEGCCKDLLPEFYNIVRLFGSPQIRNVATLAGNLAHGSPIADSLCFLLVMGAELELVGAGGGRRVPVDRFYKGYKVKDLAPDEIITRVHIPLPEPGDLLRLYKVSRRTDLDIATFGAGVRVRRSAGRVGRAWVAYAGVGPTVQRLPATEASLRGRPFTEDTFRAAGQVARGEVRPITDVRGSRDFRLQLAENILLKFYHDCAGAECPEDGWVSREPTPSG